MLFSLLYYLFLTLCSLCCFMQNTSQRLWLFSHFKMVICSGQRLPLCCIEPPKSDYNGEMKGSLVTKIIISKPNHVFKITFCCILLVSQSKKISCFLFSSLSSTCIIQQLLRSPSLTAD